jgi:hypothetical protein
MRLGQRREVTFAIALAGAALVSGLWAPTSADAGDIFGHTIPRETLAQDYRTGGVYYAPPIPYGHYAKDGVAGCVHGAAGLLHGGVGKLCGLCFGKGCGSCGGQGCNHGDPCGSCGGNGCGSCGGLGLFKKHHHGADPCSGLCGGDGVSLTGGHDHGLGLGHGHGGVVPSSQAVPSGQYAPSVCGDCGGKGLLHGGLFGRKSGACGSCGGKGLLHGGPGHGGLGLGHGHGDACGDGGCGHAGGGDPCGSCGGKGCGLCGGLGSKLLGLPGGLLHRGPKVEYFVGPGGPVPLTPGYVPYVVPVRSPRDFFAFPPFVDRAF